MVYIPGLLRIAHSDLEKFWRPLRSYHLMGRSFLKKCIHRAQGLGIWGWPEQGEMSAPNPNPQRKSSLRAVVQAEENWQTRLRSTQGIESRWCWISEREREREEEIINNSKIMNFWKSSFKKFCLLRHGRVASQGLRANWSISPICRATSGPSPGCACKEKGNISN